MTIRLSCPGCGHPVDCDDTSAGMIEVCPHCRQEMRVPDRPRRKERRGRDDDDRRPPRRRRHITVPANASLEHVGEPLEEYTVSGSTFKLVIGIVLIVFGLPFLLFLPLGLVFLALGTWLVVSGVSGSGRRVIVCEDGFLDCHGSDARDVTWREVDSLYEKVTQVVNEWGAHLRTEYLYTVVLDNGKELTFTHSFSKIEALGNLFQREVARAHLPRALKALDAGKWLDFEDIRVSRRGLEVKGDRLDWDELGELSADEGYLTIHQRFRTREFARVKFANIPNVKLLMEVIDEASRG